MPFVFFGNQQTIRLVWLIYGIFFEIMWKQIWAITLTNRRGRKQSFEPIAIQMQKKKLSVGFAKLASLGLTQRLFFNILPSSLQYVYSAHIWEQSPRRIFVSWFKSPF